MHWFDNDEYARILDGLVVACVDVLVCSPSGKVLLGKRMRLPLINWWLFGGRMKPHETIEQATARAMERELGVKEFEYNGLVGYYLLDWSQRHEEPRQNGCTHLLIAPRVTINESDAKNLYPDAHSAIKWFSKEELAVLDCDYYLKQVLKDAGVLETSKAGVVSGWQA